MTRQPSSLDWPALLSDLMERAAPLLDEPHLESMRDGLTSLTPVLILGSLALLLRELPLLPWQRMVTEHAWIARWLQALFKLTFGCFSLYVVCAVSLRLAQRKAIQPAWPTGLAVLAFGLLTIERLRPALAARFGPENLVLALVVALLTVEACALSVADAQASPETKSTPREWHPVVARALLSLAIVGLACLARLLPSLTAFNTLLGLGDHLVSLLSSGPACVLTEVAHSLLWVLGIDGNLILGSALQPLLTGNAVANGLARWSGQAPRWIYSDLFRVYVVAGGSGTTLPLAIYLSRSRSQRLRQAGRENLRAGFFNRNESLIFDTPIIFNPLLAVPFVVVTGLNATAAYVAHALGWVTPAYIYLPRALPAPLSAWLSTGYDVRALALSIATWLVIPAIVWLPFFKVWERRILLSERLGGDEGTQP